MTRNTYCFARAGSHFASAVAVLIATSIAALANDSAYTKIPDDIGVCETLFVDDEAGGGSWRCPGYKDYAVILAEGDLRMSVAYGELNTRSLEAWQSFGIFNSIGNTVEWRLDSAGTPFATILRWKTDGIDGDGNMNEALGGQVLVVSKVGQPGNGEACVIGYVDARANGNANELARDAADQHGVSFSCATDQAPWYGIRGPFAPEPSSSY
jgi:hypothetical protein